MVAVVSTPEKTLYHCYVDESGDEGFKFDRGSSMWFVLSAVVVKDADEPEVRSTIDTLLTDLWVSRGKAAPKDLHWRKLKHSQKLYVSDKLKGVSECRRELKKGGVLTIVTPNKLSPARSSYHIPLPGPTEARSWLLDAGFQGVRHGYYGFSRASGKLTSKLARLPEVAGSVPGVRRMGAFMWVSGAN